MCKGCTAAGGSRLLWTRREFRIRIFMGLIVLTLEFVTKLTMRPEGILTLGRIPIYEVCADGPGRLE
jgi:hypothetical protein